jgi:quinol monooxygenase YgiN
MTTMVVRHKVSNYETWRKAYDDFASVQKAKGVTGQAAYQATDNPNDITVTHDFASVAAAQDFVNSDELKKAMQGGGVVGAPSIWFTNKK